MKHWSLEVGDCIFNIDLGSTPNVEQSALMLASCIEVAKTEEIALVVEPACDDPSILEQ